MRRRGRRERQAQRRQRRRQERRGFPVGMVARGGEGAQGWRGIRPGEQGMGRGESDRRRQQGQRGGRARGIGRAARRHARVTPEMLQQLLRRGESLAAVRGVARDPVAHVG